MLHEFTKSDFGFTYAEEFVQCMHHFMETGKKIAHGNLFSRKFEMIKFYLYLLEHINYKAYHCCRQYYNI